MDSSAISPRNGHPVHYSRIMTPLSEQSNYSGINSFWRKQEGQNGAGGKLLTTGPEARC